MKKFIIILSSIIIGSSMIGCGGNTPSPSSRYSKPLWVLHPNLDGKKGAVGIAGRTYDMNISSQRKLAIQRALDELASTQKVNVQLVMNKEENYTHGQNHLQLKSQSSYKTNVTLSAHIEDIWEDKLSGELYVWLVLDN